MIFPAVFFGFPAESLRFILRKRKVKHFREDKTHKTLTRKILSGIRLSVTKVTVFETSEGIGERSRETLGENNSRAVCSCYDAPR